MITPGEGFFKPAASSLLIVLFCYLCESERENLVFSPAEDFLLFLGSSQRKRPPNISSQEPRNTRESSKKKTTKADRVHNNKSSRTRGERARLNLRERNETSEKAKFCPRIQKRIRIVPLLLQIVYYCSLL
jgi:hypothetical protein